MLPITRVFSFLKIKSLTLTEDAVFFWFLNVFKIMGQRKGNLLGMTKLCRVHG